MYLFRYFLIYALVALLIGCSSTDNPPAAIPVATNDNFRWKLVTTWPSSFPIFHEQLLKFSHSIELMSRGRLKIEVYGSGIIVPPAQVFDAVSQGDAEMGHSVSFYWVDKIPAAQFMSSIPFGMTANGMNAWLYYGNGLQLWRKLYEPYHVIPFPAGNTGLQMGGWFKKPIKTIKDFEGLKIRMPGLNGKVLERVGASLVTLTASEINTAFRRGVIDAAEWIGPAHDEALGLYRETEYYYYPGWHEPGTTLELLINQSAWNQLPPDLQHIVETATIALNQTISNEFDAKNIEALSRLIHQHHVKLVEFPPAVLADLKKTTLKLLEEKAEHDPLFAEVYRSYRTFQTKNLQWYKITDRAYYAQEFRE